jgi:hypothetical protein
LSYTWEYDFLKMAADIFSLLVLGLLPVTAVILFAVYMKKIITAWFETHKMQLDFKNRSRSRGR